MPVPSPGDGAAEVLRSATLDVTRSLDLDAIFTSLLEHLARLVPYDTANVMLLEGKKRTRVGYRIEEDGTKVRISRRTGKEV